jgi:hypothetical protein
MKMCVEITKVQMLDGFRAAAYKSFEKQLQPEMRAIIPTHLQLEMAIVWINQCANVVYEWLMPLVEQITASTCESTHEAEIIAETWKDIAEIMLNVNHVRDIGTAGEQ